MENKIVYQNILRTIMYYDEPAVLDFFINQLSDTKKCHPNFESFCFHIANKEKANKCIEYMLDNGCSTPALDEYTDRKDKLKVIKAEQKAASSFPKSNQRRKGGEINDKNKYAYQNIIQTIISEDRADVLDFMLLHHSECEQSFSVFEYSAFSEATRKLSKKCAKLLIDIGYDTSFAYREAVRLSKWEMMEFYQEQKVPFPKVVEGESTLLHEAASSYPYFFEKMLKLNEEKLHIDINHLNENGQTLGFEAAYFGKKENLIAAIKAGLDISIKDEKEQTLLDRLKAAPFFSYSTELNIKEAVLVAAGLKKPVQEQTITLSKDETYLSQTERYELEIPTKRTGPRRETVGHKNKRIADAQQTDIEEKKPVRISRDNRKGHQPRRGGRGCRF